MFSKSHLKIVAASTVGILGLTQAANASLTLDLRFAPGANSSSPHTYDIPSPGVLTPITIQIWAVATGTLGNAADEGVQAAIAAARSNIVIPGVTGSITSATLGTGWNGSGTFVGSSSNLSADGIGDWGNASATPLTITAANGYMRARTVKSTNNPIDFGDANSPGGSVFNSLPDGGAEFLVGNLVFTPTTAQLGAQLQYAPATPVNGGTPATGNWWEDTADNTAPSPTGARSNATGTYGPTNPNVASINAVTINVLPEPTSLGFLGLGALGVLRRRRA